MYASAIALDLPLSDDQRLAFEACFRTHRNKVFRIGLRYGRGRAQWAEDLTQDVFMKLLEELPQLDEHEDLGGWLYRVSVNAALSRLRTEKSVLVRLARAVAGDSHEADERADTRLELSEDARRAQQLFDTLPPKERVVLSMKVLDGLQQREIAKTLGMSEGYVSKLLTRAWQKVQDAGWSFDVQQRKAGGES